MIESQILIGQRAVGTGSKVLVIAEIGINHGGNVDMAHRLVDAAADAGADAVKFQTFRADKLMIPIRDRLAQQIDGSESAYEMFQRMELTPEAHAQLKDHADRRRVFFLSTPFDEESADLLEKIGVPAYKIASADITHFPLLRHVAAKRKPVLLSTGMSFLNEVSDALLTLKSAGAKEIALLHCTSCYPAPADQLNLRAIGTLRDHFGLPVGYSDHTQGLLCPMMAVALGASVLEKHFTLDKLASGPDHKLSMDPSELRSLVDGLREVEAGLGNGRKCPMPAEQDNRRMSRRSIVASVDIRAYATIEPHMLSFKRPGEGIEPKHLEHVIGMCSRCDIARDRVLHWGDLLPSVPACKPRAETNSESRFGALTSTHR